MFATVLPKKLSMIQILPSSPGNSIPTGTTFGTPSLLAVARENTRIAFMHSFISGVSSLPQFSHDMGG